MLCAMVRHGVVIRNDAVLSKMTQWVWHKILTGAVVVRPKVADLEPSVECRTR